jgi:hypothetical protein
MKIEDKKDDKKAQGITVTLDNSDFDIDFYLENYSGFTKIRRMLCIAERCPALTEKLIERVHKELKLGNNTIIYKEIWEKHATTL